MSSSRSHQLGDDFLERSYSFLSWLRNTAGTRLSSKIALADFRSQGAGRGVAAVSEISEDEEIFAIPRTVVLSVENSLLHKHLSTNLGELGPWLSLMLVMIYEYLRGPSSPWFSYFAVLPKQFNTMMFWSKEELAELQGSAIVHKIGKQEADESVLRLIAPVIREHTSLFPPSKDVPSFEGQEGEQAILQLAHRMGSLIMAYAFDIEADEDREEDRDEDGLVTDDEEEPPKGMVPMADMLNADADRNNARLFQEEGFLVMKAIKPIKASEEIFNDYGPLPRSDLLRRYGYVTGNYAQYDVVEFSFDVVCRVKGYESAEPGPENPALEYLEELDLLQHGYTISRPLPGESLPDVIPEDLLTLIWALDLQSTQIKALQAEKKAAKPDFGLQIAYSLQKLVTERLAQFATTITDDKALQRSLHRADSDVDAVAMAQSQRLKLAIQVRLGEKQILHRISELIEEYLDDEQGGSRKSMGTGQSKRIIQDGQRQAKRTKLDNLKSG